MDGYDVCILAYGATGSGKTHTMHGATSGRDDQQRGIVPRACERLSDVAAPACRTLSGIAILECYVEFFKDFGWRLVSGLWTMIWVESSKVYARLSWLSREHVSIL